MPLNTPTDLLGREFTFQSAAAATGNGNVMDVSDLATLAVQVTGTFVGTITPEGTVDGTNWIAIPNYAQSDRAWKGTFTATGIYNVPVAGLRQIRYRISAYTSGAITVVGLGSSAPLTQLAAHWTAAGDTGPHFAGLAVNSQGMTYSGATWDRARSNVDSTPLASAARTATVNSADQTNSNGRGVLVTLNVTALADTPSVVLSIEGKMGSVYEALLTAAAAVTATGIHSYLVYPGCGAASADVVQVAGFPLPRTWRVTVTHGDADSITYSVTASVIL